MKAKVKWQMTMWPFYTKLEIYYYGYYYSKAMSKIGHRIIYLKWRLPHHNTYFQESKIAVKWHGCRSVPRKIHGGGPQGATLGILEYLSQSNNNADLVSDLDRYKFVDDLSVLEIIDLLTDGITSYNLKHHIPSDLPIYTCSKCTIPVLVYIV